MSVASDANNLENQRRVLADCEQVFEDVGSGASWNRPGLNRLKAALQPGDCVKVAVLDRLDRLLPEELELLGWLRENQVEVISLRESIDQDSAMGRACLSGWKGELFCVPFLCQATPSPRGSAPKERMIGRPR